MKRWFILLFICIFILITLSSLIPATEIGIKKINTQNNKLIVDFYAFKNDTRKYLVKVSLNCDDSEQIQKFYARKKNTLYNFTAEFNRTGSKCVLLIEGLGKSIKYDIDTDESVRINNFEVVPDYNSAFVFVEVVGNASQFELISKIYRDNNLIKTCKREYPLANKRLVEQDFNLEPQQYIVQEELLLNGQLTDTKENKIEVLGKSNNGTKRDVNKDRNIRVNISNQSKKNDENIGANERKNNSNKTIDVISINSNSKDSNLKSGGKDTKENTALGSSTDSRGRNKMSGFISNYNILVAVYVFLFLSIILNIVLIIKR